MFKKLIICLFILLITNHVKSRLNLKSDYSQKHIIGYSKSDNLNFYNQNIKWESIDTLVIPPSLSNIKKIIKTAQTNNVNGVLNIEGNGISDQSIKEVISKVIEYDADGVSLIFYKYPQSDDNYLSIVYKMGSLLKQISNDIHFSVSISIKNQPYSFEKLIKLDYVDYVIANAYDMGEFYGNVTPNSDGNYVRKLIKKWSSTKKINKNKIILGISWYGYKYECDMFPLGLYTSHCVNSRKPQYLEYYDIYNYLVGNDIQDTLYISSNEIFNQTSFTPYINIREINGDNYDITSNQLLKYYQIQYDNPISTYLKIKSNSIGGVGVYSLDTLFGLNQNIISAMYSSINRDFL